MSRHDAPSMFSAELVRPALLDAFRKLNPAIQARNPVMFVTLVGSALTLVLGLRQLAVGEPWGFTAAVSAWLWFTVLFASFAEAIAEGRGKAQAATLRRMRSEVHARRQTPTGEERVAGSALRKGDCVICEAGDVIPDTGGVRKVRWSRAGMGKRGGARVIYFYHDDTMPLYLLLAYAKAQRENLTPDEKRQVRALVSGLKQVHRKR